MPNDLIAPLVALATRTRKKVAPTIIESIVGQIAALAAEIVTIDTAIAAHEQTIAALKDSSQTLALAAFRGDTQAQSRLDGIDIELDKLHDIQLPRLRAAKTTAKFRIAGLEKDLQIAEQAKRDAEDADAVAKLRVLAADADAKMAIAVAAVTAFCDQDDQVMQRLMAKNSRSTPPSPLAHRLVWALSAHLCGERMLAAYRSTRVTCSVTDARANGGRGFRFVDIIPALRGEE